MKKIKIITDSTAYLEEDFIEKEGISVVGLNYVIGGKSYTESKPGTFDEFFNKLSTSDLFPTTSQPPAGEFIKAYEDAFNEGYDHIIVVLLSSKLSGTYNSALLGKSTLEDKSISIIDSQVSAGGLFILIKEALALIKENKDIDYITNRLNEMKKDIRIFLTTDSLEYLSRGGRISDFKSKLANVLNIKPIIELKDGELQLAEKSRGSKKARNLLCSKIAEARREVIIHHVMNIDLAKELEGSIKDQYKLDVSIKELGPVIGSHLGPGAIGICFY